MGNKTHNQAPGAVLRHVAENIRQLRLAAGLSQQALAEAAGLSRRLVVGLEGGEANISLTNLDALAGALGVRFADLVRQPDAAEESRRIEETVWRGQSAQSRAVLLAAAPARQGVELWSWSLDVGERYAAHADRAGWHELIVVTEGRLRLEAEGRVQILEAGGCAVFDSSKPYSYENAGTTCLRFIRNVAY